MSRTFCRWIGYFTRFPDHLIQEQNLAHSIFGKQLGEEVFFEVNKGATSTCMGMATSLLSFKKIPEKVQSNTTPMLGIGLLPSSMTCLGHMGVIYVQNQMVKRKLHKAYCENITDVLL